MLLSNLTLTEADVGELQVSIGQAQLHRVPRRPHVHCRRDVFTDQHLAVAVKIEHSTSDSEPYQCWNEFTIWQEYVQDSVLADYLAPTLEMGVFLCPIHDGCVLAVNVQEYIDDGYPRTFNYARPYKDCMSYVLRELGLLGLSLDRDVVDREWQQCVFSLERERFILVDYGLVAGAPGVRLTSRRRPDGFWQWVRSALGRY